MNEDDEENEVRGQVGESGEKMGVFHSDPVLCGTGVRSAGMGSECESITKSEQGYESVLT